MTTESNTPHDTPHDTPQATEASGLSGAGEMVVAETAGDVIRFSDRVWSLPWMGTFLDALAVMPVVAQAARAAGVGRQWANKMRLKDAEFAEAFEEARRRGVDLMEQNSWRWATVGVEVTETTVVRDGNGRILKEVTTTRVDRNAQIAMMMLKAHRPEYRDSTKVEHSGPSGGPVQFQVDRMPTPERMRALAQVAREMEELDRLAAEKAAVERIEDGEFEEIELPDG